LKRGLGGGGGGSNNNNFLRLSLGGGYGSPGAVGSWAKRNSAAVS
jgi:hypothetical protein